MGHVQNIITVRGERVRAYYLSPKVSNRVALIAPKLNPVLRKLQDAGKTLNREKCHFLFM